MFISDSAKENGIKDPDALPNNYFADYYNSHDLAARLAVKGGIEDDSESGLGIIVIGLFISAVFAWGLSTFSKREDARRSVKRIFVFWKLFLIIVSLQSIFLLMGGALDSVGALRDVLQAVGLSEHRRAVQFSIVSLLLIGLLRLTLL